MNINNNIINNFLNFIKNNKKILINTIGFIIVIICFFFIYKMFRKIDFSSIREKINCIWILYIFLFSFLYFLIFQIQGITWKRNIEIISGVKINIFEALSIYSTMNIAKYLPGNVFVFIGRHLILRKKGISDIKIILINGIEILCFLGISLLFAFIGSNFGIIDIPSEYLKNINFKLLIFIIIIIIISGLIIFFIFFNKKFINEIKKILSLENIIKFNFNLLLYVLYFFIYGFFNAIFFIVFLNYDISLINLLQIIFGFSLAWVLGYIVPGASGGIGVRELVFIVVLSTYLSYTNVFIISILSRIITLCGEIISFFLIPFIYKLLKWYSDRKNI